MTRSKQQLLQRWFSALAVFSLLALDVHMALAATLTTPRIYLNRQKVNMAAANTVQYDVFFTVVTGITNGKVKINFPTNNTDDDTKWCRTAGSDLTVLGVTDPSGATESATALPGTLAGSCTHVYGHRERRKVRRSYFERFYRKTWYRFRSCAAE